MVTNKSESSAGASPNVEKVKRIDFKMVSFTLSGKEYGIDIMKVKEIRKSGNFTKVPNTPVYVKGVDNLRGDIIPIIDLRVMFHLPAETKVQGSLENIIIIRLEDLILGVIVDTIEKVVGVSKESIQPPHPLFGDINIQYIQGVVEYENLLYILLDVDKIFGKPEPQNHDSEMREEGPKSNQPAQIIVEDSTEDRSQGSLDLQFISESLVAFAGFHVSPLNKTWVKEKLIKWKADRLSKGLDFQFTTKEDAVEFLKDFHSSNSSRLWNPDEIESLSKLFQFADSNTMVWNPGCGKGYETYSLSLLFETYFPKLNYKVWGNDSDLLNISTAPSLAFEEAALPKAHEKYFVKTKAGMQFTSEIKSHLFFEFHDIRNMNPFNDLSVIVARDILSFMKPAEQERMLSEFFEKLKPEGYLLLGENESVLNELEWRCISRDQWVLFQKIS